MFITSIYFYMNKTNSVSTMFMNTIFSISLMILLVSFGCNYLILMFLSMFYIGGMMIMFSFCLSLVKFKKTYILKKSSIFLFLPFLLINYFCFKKSNLIFNFLLETLWSIFFMLLILMMMSYILTLTIKEKKCLKTMS